MADSGILIFGRYIMILNIRKYFLKHVETLFDFRNFCKHLIGRYDIQQIFGVV